MTVSQRNAIASGMLAEEGTSVPGKQEKARRPSASQQAADESADHSGSNHSSDEEQRDPLETWCVQACSWPAWLDVAGGYARCVRPAQ